MVLGINRRNALIARENPRTSVRLVRDKVATKHALSAAGIAVPPTLALLRDRTDVADDRWLDAADSWVIKPARGSQGRGVLVVTARDRHLRQVAGGRWLDAAALRLHADGILDGEFTDGRPDEALVEPLLASHDAIAQLCPSGLPDIRVICHRGDVLMAMMRMPTAASGGRGNLHQGGLGAAVELTTGRIWRAMQAGQLLDAHPDTAQPLVGMSVPMWSKVCEAAIAAVKACGLGYAGVDLVIDRHLGVLVLEVNAHPGLEIQNVCAASLVDRLDRRR
jgi:alpha-L-glutamate ligase-like protein